MRRTAHREGRHLYLLAGTPTPDGATGFPVRLYAVAGGRLALVRQVANGLFSVANDLAGHLYVLNLGQTSVSVIHENAPSEVDVVTAPLGGKGRPAQFLFDYATWGAVAGPGVSPSAVLASWTDHWTVSRVFADGILGRPRVVQGNWDLYRDFRYAGAAGGPYPSPTEPSACIVAHSIAIEWGGDYAYGLGVLSRAPPSLPPTTGLEPTPAGMPRPNFKTRWVRVLADTARFFLFGARARGGGPEGPWTIYVLSKAEKRWAVVKVPFYILPPRLFGDWLATRVQEPNPTDRVSPGLKNERAREVDVDTPTGVVRELPRIRGMYPSDDVFMPGKLLLQNLEDGRKVTIDTGQQDSEVLEVGKDGLVLYRVNDEIFSSKIEGKKLGPSKLVVKGKDVPEVHWAFWSNAQAEPAPAAKRRPVHRLHGSQRQLPK